MADPWWKIAKHLYERRKEFAATKERPCRVCQKTDWCVHSEAGALCHRSGGIGAVIDNRTGKPATWGKTKAWWVHVLDGELPKLEPIRKPARRKTDSELHRIFSPLAAHLYAHKGPEVADLAKTLGVSLVALQAIEVGYGFCGNLKCWSFPERNARGEIIGISRRLVEPQPNGNNKQSAPGGRRGLVYCDGWEKFPGPILLVEGGSDVAAGLTLGLAIIGRPNNVGGADYLTPMLCRHRDRRIIVVGERDRKPQEKLSETLQKTHDPHCSGCSVCWPGKHGALSLAAELTKRLRRPVCSVMISKSKDLRRWLNDQKIDVDDPAQVYETRKRLLRTIGA